MPCGSGANMILDSLENSHLYTCLGHGFADAFAFLRQPNLETLPVQTHEIHSKRLFAIVSRGPGRRREDAKLEIHRKYIDIQFVISGTDTMGWAPLASCSHPASSYDKGKDIRFFSDDPESWVKVQPGRFVIFFPDDAHLPAISSGEIHKVVVKVAVVR